MPNNSNFSNNIQIQIILEAGADGESIELSFDGRHYSYLSDETTMLDLLPGEYKRGELKKISLKFSTFEEAFERLMARYPIFHLYPIKLNPFYASRVEAYFMKYKLIDTRHKEWGFANCEDIFRNSKE